eukprot:3793723-Amphidinium_carterae.1
MAESKHFQFSLAVLLSLWSYCRAVSLYGERTLQTSSCNAWQTVQRRAVAHNATLTLWFFAVFFAAGPSSLYSTVKAVPGFLHVNTFWQWIISQGVSLCMAVLTSVGLPALARSLRKRTNRFSVTDLVVVGKLSAAILLPCVVTCLCHADCLGGWTYFWKPCITLD